MNIRWRNSLSGLALAIGLALVLNACSGGPSAPTPPSLKVTGITPNMGSTTGGTTVTVTGTQFGTDATLTVGGVAATNVVVQSATTITATLAPHPAGSSDVVVSSGGKLSTLNNGFVFYAPTGNNQPPTVSGARTVGPRLNQPSGFANVGDTVTLIPTVFNAESSSTLTYDWSGQGTFTPTTDGTTSWHLPGSVSPAPQAITATLTVTETFTEGGVTHRQQSTPFAFTMQLHDSEKEVLDMGEDFLTLFTRQLPSDQVLHNFSRTCDGGKGRSEEESDGANNRRDLIEDFGAFRITRRAGFTINFKSFCPVTDKPPQLNTDACSSFAVHWEGVDKSNNQRFVTNGIDWVSAVVENNQWYLCHSSFSGTQSYPALGITRQVSW